MENQKERYHLGDSVYERIILKLTELAHDNVQRNAFVIIVMILLVP
jgi:hypothetical protein